MYSVLGYEHIKSKDSQVFTKVYISQNINAQKGSKPFPISYMVAGEVDFTPGSQIEVVLDQKQDGSLFISGIREVVQEGTVII